MKQRDQYFDEDFVEGAVASLRLSIRRVQWRASSGEWPSELIGANRKRMEEQIEQLVKAELERCRLGEVTPDERTGPVIHRHRRGKWRMIPLER
jgi:hypothetical protein